MLFRSLAVTQYSTPVSPRQIVVMLIPCSSDWLALSGQVPRTWVMSIDTKVFSGIMADGLGDGVTVQYWLLEVGQRMEDGSYYMCDVARMKCKGHMRQVGTASFSCRIMDGAGDPLSPFVVES